MNPWNDARIPLVTWLVSTVDERGRGNASPKVWCIPTSYDPPLAMLSCKPESDTVRNIDQTGIAVLHVPSPDLAEHVLHTAEPLPHGTNELDRHGWRYSWFHEEGVTPRPIPYVPTVPWFYCMATSRVESGDHVVFELRVVRSGGYELAQFGQYGPAWRGDRYVGGVGQVLLHRGRNVFTKSNSSFSVEPY